MKRLLLVCTAALLPFAVVAIASATDFAAGSAKTETSLTVADLGEHASFQVHCLKGATCDASSFTNCQATGHMVYKADASPYAGGGPLAFRAKFTQLQIRFGPDTGIPAGTARAAIFGTITDVAEGPQTLVGQTFLVDIFDSGLPGGTGDRFLLEAPRDNNPGGTCSSPLEGKPIDKGNIVIKRSP